MGCLFVLMAGIFPRLALVIVWIARPAMVDRAFDSWLWPLLGLIFLPWTSICYALAWGPIQHVSGAGWLLVAIGVFLDVASYASRSAKARFGPA